MKKIAKSLMLAFALVLALSVGAGSTAEAAKKVTVKKVTSVDKLTGKKSITLTKGKKATLTTTVTVTPDKKANKKVTYKSSNKKVATVTSKGVIKAVKTGSAKITVVSKKNSKKKATVKVKVVAGKVTKVTTDKTTATLKVGATETVKATVKTKGKKANKTLVWTSSDEKVATVKNGVITGVAAGKATITVESTDGTNKSAKIAVTVEDYKTTVAPVDKKTVSAEIEFSGDVAKIQADVDKIAKFSKDTKVVINLDGTDYTAEVVNGTVKINGKALAESEKAKAAKKVVVKTEIKSDKIASVTAFAPESVKSVKIGKVTFTDITATSFKIGETTYTYVVDGKNIVVTGDAKAALEGLGDVVTITVK